MTTKSMAKTSVAAKAAVEETKEEKKTWKPDDLIPCRSMVNGGLYIEGYRTKMLYSWADYGDVMDVEYQDLIYMIRTNADKSIYEPRIIIEDEELVEQYPKIKEMYDSMFTVSDLREILNLTPAKMRDTIATLPKGAKEALKGIASTMIDNKSLDSVGKIKVLDEIFGTNMLLALVQE